MRRLMVPKNDDGERGAIAVLVALLLVVLLGFAALAVDAGMLYSERAQVQNGSDAAALAVAQKCAANTSDPNCSTTSQIASDIANKNANDGLNNIKSINLDLANRKVTVTAGAQQAGGAPNAVSLFFARVLGVNSTSVVTSSSVQWGSPVAGTTAFPLAFSICQVQGYIGGALQLLQDHSSGANPSCNYGPSGAVAPGVSAGSLRMPGCVAPRSTSPRAKPAAPRGTVRLTVRSKSGPIPSTPGGMSSSCSRSSTP